MKLHERAWLVGFLVFFFLLATVYNVVSTPFEAPDEIGHFYFVAYLLRERHLPVIPAPIPTPNYEQEGTQAPLYYLGGAALLDALRGSLQLDFSDERTPFVFNFHNLCSRPNARTNVVALAHDPHQERFPYAGRVRSLHVLRLWSSLLATATVAGVFLTARLLCPKRPRVAWFAAALAAFTPEFLFTAGAANNDNMITLMATWSVYMALRILRDGVTWPKLIALSLLSGLAALSKLGGLLLLPFAGAVLCLNAYLRRPQGDLRRHVLITLGQLALLGALFAAVAGWWYFYNWRLYGDFTAVKAHLAVVGDRVTPMSWGLFFQELPGLFLSWWGVFGCTLPPLSFYIFCGIITLGGVAGLIAGRRALSWPQLVAVLLWLALMAAGYVRWNWVAHAAKGRLLYPTMSMVVFFLAQGWDYWAERWPRVTQLLPAALSAVAIAIPFAVMAPAVALPPIAAGPVAVAPRTPFAGQFGDSIALLGYDLNATSFESGDELDLTLYWHVLARPDRHYSLALQLVSAYPADVTTLVNVNLWPGNGAYPTGNWRPGDVIIDRYRFTIADTAARTQGWVLTAALYDLESGARLPFTLNEQPAGDAARLITVRVGAVEAVVAESAPPAEYQAATPVTFGGAITLDGVAVVVEGNSVTLDMWWRCAAPPPTDWVTFIHFYDAHGTQILTGDGPPLLNSFPTSLWQPGDRIHDVRTLVIPEDAAAPLRLGLGWYNPLTGERPAAVAEEQRLPDDALYLPVGP